MNFCMNKELKQMLYPYMFVLKEGPEFDNDSLSYSLLMLQVNTETLQSPKQIKKIKKTANSELDMLRASIPQALAQM